MTDSRFNKEKVRSELGSLSFEKILCYYFNCFGFDANFEDFAKLSKDKFKEWAIAEIVDKVPYIQLLGDKIISSDCIETTIKKCVVKFDGECDEIEASICIGSTDGVNKDEILEFCKNDIEYGNLFTENNGRGFTIVRVLN